MISGLGFQEIMVILLLALIVFGPKRLPELARQLGRIMRELRKLAWEFRSALELESFENESKGANETPSMVEMGYEQPSDQPLRRDDGDEVTDV